MARSRRRQNLLSTRRRSPCASCRATGGAVNDAVCDEVVFADYPSGARLCQGHGRGRRARHPPAGPVDGTVYDFVPLAHLREGMTVLVDDEAGGLRRGPGRRGRGRRLRRPGATTSRSTPTHTYVADGVLVHNSIYASGAPTCGTSSSSRTPSPTRRWCCSSRTTDRPRRSSTPPTRSSPTTWPASPRSCGPTRASATRSCATTPTTRSTRRSGSPTRSPASTPSGDHRWGDIAVFYRTNAQSRVLEEQLMRADIPYKVVGGTRFYDRREVKDAVAYLRAVVNPVDEVSLKRVHQRAQAGRRRHVHRQARRLGHGPRAVVHGRPAAGRRRRGQRQGPAWHRRLPHAARRRRRR